MNIEELNIRWELLTYQSKDHFKSASLLQHHAIQFIALAGRYLAVKKDNGENISMEWYLNKKMLVGTWIDAKKFPLKIGLRLEDLLLMILDPSFTEFASLNIQGRTKEEVFDWLNDKLKELKVEMGAMKMEIFYDLPHHETDDGAPFEIRNKDEMMELVKLRTNTDIVLRYFSQFFNGITPIRIWPHNFDTHITIPVEYEDTGNLLKYVNMGLAVPNTFSDRHYFFVSHWDKNESADYDKIKKLEGEGHWTTRNQVIAILPVNRVNCDKTKESQLNRVVSFYKSALNNTFDILSCPEKKTFL